MAVKQVKWNYAGLGSILRGEEIRADLERRAKAIADAASGASGGETYLADSSIGKRRARASVRTGSIAAARKEAVDHVLLRSIDAGRG